MIRIFDQYTITYSRKDNGAILMKESCWLLGLYLTMAMAEAVAPTLADGKVAQIKATYSITKHGVLTKIINYLTRRA